MFDIANFYDSIDLRRLETSVRAVSPGFHFPINVLFHLLKTALSRNSTGLMRALA
jgi:hypothetical protein